MHGMDFMPLSDQFAPDFKSLKLQSQQLETGRLLENTSFIVTFMPQRNKNALNVRVESDRPS